MMKTPKIYSLNFPRQHTAVLAVIVMLHVTSYIPRTYLLYSWKFVPLNHLPPVYSFLAFFFFFWLFGVFYGSI